jgi:hypothetical protein
MAHSDTLTLESDWLPATELRRLVGAQQAEFPTLSIATRDSDVRGIDPAMAVAVVSGVVAVALPFVTRLAERLFAMEPKASVTISTTNGDSTVELRATLPAKVAGEMVERALAAGADRVRITLPPDDG